MKLTRFFAQTLGIVLTLGLSVDSTVSESEDNACEPHHSSSPPHHRSKTCHVESHCDGSDDSEFIMHALRKCNHGGKVVFHEDKEYTIGSALDMTFLKHVDIGL